MDVRFPLAYSTSRVRRQSCWFAGRENRLRGLILEVWLLTPSPYLNSCIHFNILDERSEATVTLAYGLKLEKKQTNQLIVACW